LRVSDCRSMQRPSYVQHATDGAFPMLRALAFVLMIASATGLSAEDDVKQQKIAELVRTVPIRLTQTPTRYRTSSDGRQKRPQAILVSDRLISDLC
jgi:hypothetical protein